MQSTKGIRARCRQISSLNVLYYGSLLYTGDLPAAAAKRIGSGEKGGGFTAATGQHFDASASRPYSR
jgi:hypothetical protein